MVSTLEYHFRQNSQAMALYRSTRGKYLPESAAHVSSALIVGCSPVAFKNMIKGRLKHVWKEDPVRVIQVMRKVFKDWELVEIELRASAKEGGASESGGSSFKEEVESTGGENTRTD